MSHLRLELTSCGCGAITGTPCSWKTSTSEAIEVEWMPLSLRQSHELAGNRGSYPSNGARRLILDPSCARKVVASDPTWTAIVG